MSGRIKVVVAGAGGKMGREVVKAILEDKQLELVGAVDVREKGTDLGVLVGKPPLGQIINSDLETLLKETQPEVMVDFTNPQSVLRNLHLALAHQTYAVVGTTGLAPGDLAEVEKKAQAKKLGVFIAPNFALGAVLLMKFAKEAVQHFPHVEIIELHHDQKLDAPSGTSLRTADLLKEIRPAFKQGASNEYEKIPGARGADVNGMRIHSVRLPGFIAHEEVIFGASGQVLTLRHDSINRECFMPGVLLAIHKVLNIEGLVIGLENILEA